uniref:Uncharacterized protein n=1 Tax=viral metagenome TaxID=1070528 RepID=A0A6C0KQI5_9ZZZZ
MANKNRSFEGLNPPPEFNKIINDFISDISITFPEYSGIISKWWGRTSENIELNKQKETLFVFRHCLRTFPERFFDILYKNVEMFNPESEINTEFLPGIVFKQLWICDISDNTKDTIWKYLQLILFSVIGTVNNSSEFGDTAKLFEAINEDELKNKLQETLENMQNMFSESNDKSEGDDKKPFTMPNAEHLHDHINSMMGGKLGKLAMELAEETAEDLNLDIEGEGDAKEVFQKLMKNPAKMMNMVKNIGSKIDEKIKSGEIKESELMQEGMELLNKMKDMPGMADMQKMFTQMGIPGLGKGAKINMGAMEAQLNRNMKNAKMKERMRSKAESNLKNKDQQQSFDTNKSRPAISEEEILKIFSTGEVVEKTPRGTKPPVNNSTENKKKKKGKK